MTKRQKCFRTTGLLGLVVALAAIPKTAHAQLDLSEYAAWLGLISTPVGAFVPSVLIPPADGDALPLRAQLRYGHWQFAPDDDNTTNVGLSLQAMSAVGGLGVEVGRTFKKGCAACATWMASAEAQLRVLAEASGPLVLALNPEFGVQFKRNAGATSLMSAAVNLNASLPLGDPAELVFIPFLAPGYGWGRMSFGGESETGFAPMLAGGLALKFGSLIGSVGLSRILVEDGEPVLGASIGFGP